MVTLIAGPHTLGGPDSSFYLLLFFRWLIKHRLDIVFNISILARIMKG